MKNEGDGNTNCIRIGKVIERFRTKRTSGDNPDNSIIKIGQNTKNSLGDMNRLVVT